MNRRNFLQLLGLLGTAQLIPSNRVWSFPSRIVIANKQGFLLDLDAISPLMNIYYHPLIVKQFNEANIVFKRFSDGGNSMPISARSMKVPI